MNTTHVARDVLTLASVIGTACAAHAAVPIMAITGFHRETSLGGYALGCSTVDNPGTTYFESNNFALPGGGVLIDPMINTAHCHSEVHGVEYLSTESPSNGAVMQFALVLSSGCLPSTICPTNLDCSLSLGSTGEVGAGLSGSTSGYTLFHLNGAATVTVTTSYNVHGDLSGRPLNQGSAGGGFTSGINGPGASDSVSAYVNVSGSAGSDSKSDNDVYTFAAPGAGNYTLSFSQIGYANYSNGSAPVASCTANETVSARITVRVVTAGLIPGDLDGDGHVNASDLAMLLGAWGGPGIADLDGDGVVGATDLGILLGNWLP